MYDLIEKKIENILDRAKLEDLLDQDRLLSDLERNEKIERIKTNIMNKYKKLNTDWEVKLNHVLQNKENNYENKMNENIGQLDKKHFKDRKINTETNASRVGDGLSNKVDRISSNIELKRSDEELDRVRLERRVYRKIKIISNNKDKSINENNQVLKEKIEEKVKKVNDANDYLQELEEKRKEQKEKQKVEQLRLYNLKKEKMKKSLEKLKEKENKKLSDIKYNLQLIEKTNEMKKEQIFEKFNVIQSRPKDLFSRRVQEFISKRQRSLEKYQQNSEKLNSQIEKQNDKLLKNFQMKIEKSTLRAKSIDISKQNIRANTIISHLGLRKKIENIYTKLKDIGENSIMNKPPEERKKELIKLRKQRELEEKLRLEQKKKEEEELNEKLWIQQQNNNMHNQSIQNSNESQLETKMKKSFFTTDLIHK